jgi:hypothetical protein
VTVSRFAADLVVPGLSLPGPLVDLDAFSHVLVLTARGAAP